ncbi:hypothetical protein TIFTF001_021438 [Ficus carica]|uniref:Uncharacterized protein n=1 Tax=Ficus carica TaxID=3494 RepID=A0AA88AGQ0_FICCA|nr:hypothetical protein TIFTF001_021438 [Ficus carica]
MVAMDLATISAMNLIGCCGHDSADCESRHLRQGRELIDMGGGKEKEERE